MIDQPHDPRSATSSRLDSRGLIVVLVLALNMRAGLASMGPLLPEIQADLNLGPTEAGILTGLPLFAFGVGAFLVPTATRKWGINGTVLGASILIAIGLSIRPFGYTGLLLLGTVLFAFGVAFANVLLPSLVKRDFPTRLGLVTGEYTTILTGSAALAAVIAVPLATFSNWGWRGSMFAFAVPSFLAVAACSSRLRSGSRERDAGTAWPGRAFWTNPTHWAVITFSGLQALGFYSTLFWLPTLLRDQGASTTEAGALLAIATVIGLPMAFMVPVIAARLRHQTAVAVTVTALNAVGLIALALDVGPSPIPWVLCIGLGQAAAFPLSILLVTLRTPSPQATAQLAAMSQGVGYLIAATGPFIVGVLYGATSAWAAPVAFLVILLVVQSVAGGFAGRSAE